LFLALARGAVEAAPALPVGEALGDLLAWALAGRLQRPAPAVEDLDRLLWESAAAGRDGLSGVDAAGPGEAARHDTAVAAFAPQASARRALVERAALDDCFARLPDFTAAAEMRLG
jgi:hypothetical protein